MERRILKFLGCGSRVVVAHSRTMFGEEACTLRDLLLFFVCGRRVATTPIRHSLRQISKFSILHTLSVRCPWPRGERSSRTSRTM
eukprot:5055009-Prymnesium_polylepis.1